MKISLVLEGGASRTLFTAGVLDVLMENNIKVDLIVGASAGISSGVSYASGQIGRNYQVYTKYMPDKRYKGFKYFFKKGNNSYYNKKFVFEDIPNIHCKYDFEALRSFDGDVIAVVTNYITGEAEYLSVDADDKAFDVLKATCALPLLFTPVTINNVKFMDGGIADSIPFEYAINQGCDKNIVILTRHRDYKKSKSKGFGILKSIYGYTKEFTAALNNRYINYNNQLLKLKEAEKSGKAFVIAPPAPLNCKRTESDPDKLKEMYETGKNAALCAISELKRYLG